MDPAPKGMNRHMKGMNCIFHVFLGAIPSGRRRPSGRYGQELAIRSALRTPVGALGLPPFGRHPFPALSQEAMVLFRKSVAGRRFVPINDRFTWRNYRLT